MHDKTTELIDCFLDDIADSALIRKLRDGIRINGFGSEFAACQFSCGIGKNDEDYFGESCVKISLQKPLYQEDVTIIVPNDVFFERLLLRTERSAAADPSLKNEAFGLLSSIRSRLEL